jgi:hypothetical protein
MTWPTTDTPYRPDRLPPFFRPKIASGLDVAERLAAAWDVGHTSRRAVTAPRGFDASGLTMVYLPGKLLP